MRCGGAGPCALGWYTTGPCECREWRFRRGKTYDCLRVFHNRILWDGASWDSASSLTRNRAEPTKTPESPLWRYASDDFGPWFGFGSLRDVWKSAHPCTAPLKVRGTGLLGFPSEDAVQVGHSKARFWPLSRIRTAVAAPQSPKAKRPIPTGAFVRLWNCGNRFDTILNTRLGPILNGLLVLLVGGALALWESPLLCDGPRDSYGAPRTKAKLRRGGAASLSHLSGQALAVELGEHRCIEKGPCHPPWMPPPPKPRDGGSRDGFTFNGKRCAQAFEKLVGKGAAFKLKSAFFELSKRRGPPKPRDAPSRPPGRKSNSRGIAAF